MKESDELETPQDFFMELNKEFRFSFDLCCTSKNKKCFRGIEDYLNFKVVPHFTSYTCFLNPPYSNPFPFIKKAWEDSLYCTIVCLIKCDPSSKTWGIFWDYKNHCPKDGCSIRFLPKRLRLEMNGEPTKRCSIFPSAIIIFDRHVERYYNEKILGL